MSWLREELLPDLPEWLIGFSSLTSATNTRTMIAAALPKAGVGNSYPVISAVKRECLLAVLNSFVFDYLTRIKVGGTNLNFFYVKQLPVPAPEAFSTNCPWNTSKTVGEWLAERVIALSCTSWSMTPMAKDVLRIPCVFPWDSEQRTYIRVEIDAAMFIIYGIGRNEVTYVLDSFGGVAENETATCGEYRTKRLILQAFDAMQEAIDTGTEYHSDVERFLEEGITR